MSNSEFSNCKLIPNEKDLTLHNINAIPPQDSLIVKHENKVKFVDFISNKNRLVCLKIKIQDLLTKFNYDNEDVFSLIEKLSLLVYKKMHTSKNLSFKALNEESCLKCSCYFYINETKQISHHQIDIIKFLDMKKKDYICYKFFINDCKEDEEYKILWKGNSTHSHHSEVPFINPDLDDNLLLKEEDCASPKSEKEYFNKSIEDLLKMTEEIFDLFKLDLENDNDALNFIYSKLYALKSENDSFELFADDQFALTLLGDKEKEAFDMIKKMKYKNLSLYLQKKSIKYINTESFMKKLKVYFRLTDERNYPIFEKYLSVNNRINSSTECLCCALIKITLKVLYNIQVDLNQFDKFLIFSKCTISKKINKIREYFKYMGIK